MLLQRVNEGSEQVCLSLWSSPCYLLFRGSTHTSVNMSPPSICPMTEKGVWGSQSTDILLGQAHLHMDGGGRFNG